MPFIFYQQLNAMDCGPTCLRMIARHYGKHYNADTLRQMSGYSKRGVSMLGISQTADKIGFRSRGVQITFEKLSQALLPAILHWDQNHFVVLISLNKKGSVVADPAKGVLSYSKEEFLNHWISNKSTETGDVGTALLLEPSPAFYEEEGENEHKMSWTVISQYLHQSRAIIFRIFVAVLVTSLLQLILPFLTQSIVDTGINTRNLQYITIVLAAQLMLTFSSTVIDLIRNRLQLRLSNSINISILSDFWIKLTRLPVSYFDSHHTGDTLQRIQDNKRIQNFLTSQTLTVFFSIFNFLVYSVVLVFYNVSLFLVFIVGNMLYFGWIQLFLRVRRKVNYAMFHVSTKENNATLELVQGMQEIRLNGAEQSKRWEWENIQVNLFKLNFKTLNYDQLQSTGALFISQGKDIFISFLVAKMVVSGQLTFGAMLAIQYIIGQLSGPVQQFIGLSQSVQDAKISMERLNEIHGLVDEEPITKTLVSDLPVNNDISFNNVSFCYPGSGDEFVLKDISLVVPQGKVTAIVGVSGSGKTTLLKLLLKIYEQYEGELKLGDINFRFISHHFWRKQCGAVLQDGYIFNDSIARNIAVGDEYIDQERLLQICSLVNIKSFVESLPNGFNTKLGAEGVGISQGQKQRILIARALYKNPRFLFFDEATNSLDANNERAIVENLNQFFEGRTVIVVAHRFSTVRHADHIVVLQEGRIVESGTHETLTATQGYYYQLVKNQLELGK